MLFDTCILSVSFSVSLRISLSVIFQGRRANKKAVKEEYNRLSDPGYAAKMRSKEKDEVSSSLGGAHTLMGFFLGSTYLWAVFYTQFARRSFIRWKMTMLIVGIVEVREIEFSFCRGSFVG